MSPLSSPSSDSDVRCVELRDEQAQPWISRATMLPIACAGCVLMATAYVVVDDPGDGAGGFGPCPIRMLTGRWCPGCGLTRATHRLFRGDIVGALSFNALVIPILGALVALWVVWFRIAADHGAPRWFRSIPAAAYASSGIVVVAFTVVRNLDGLMILRGG